MALLLAADPLLLRAGLWLAVAGAALTLLTAVAFLGGWGVRFRLVGITSFTVLLALSCAAFAISYRPRLTIPGAVTVPVVFDNGGDLVVAAAPPDLSEAAVAPSLEQLARNLRGSGRQSSDGQVRVRLRRLEAVAPGLSRPVVLAEVRRNLADGTIEPVEASASGVRRAK